MQAIRACLDQRRTFIEWWAVVVLSGLLVFAAAPVGAQDPAVPSEHVETRGEAPSEEREENESAVPAQEAASTKPVPDAPENGVVSPAPSPLAELVETFPVTYREQTAFSILTSAAGRKAPTRAREATKALTAAIEAKAPAYEGAPPADVVLEGRVAIVRVRGYVVTPLYGIDAETAGYPSLKDYAEHIRSVLSEFVPRQMWRKRLQQGVLQFFLSVFFAVIGLMVLSQLRRAFDQADRVLEERRGSFRPIVVLGEPLLGGEAVGGLLAFGLAVGRIFAYVLAVAATLAVILGQYATTRDLLAQFVRKSTEPIFNALETLVRSIPGLLLAIVLALILHAGLRVLNLFLRGVSSGRITWRGISPSRVVVLRAAVSSFLVLLLAPLIITSAFGRFFTPMEVLFLLAAAAAFLATVPALAAFAVGAVVLWKEKLKQGDWIEVGRIRGEVHSLTLGEVRLVPESGGLISVSMFYLLLHPLHRFNRVQGPAVEVQVRRDRPVRELLDAVEKAVPDSSSSTIELLDLGAESIRIRIQMSIVRPGGRHALMLALAEAAENQAFTLSGVAETPVENHR